MFLGFLIFGLFGYIFSIKISNFQMLRCAKFKVVFRKSRQSYFHIWHKKLGNFFRENLIPPYNTHETYMGIISDEVQWWVFTLGIGRWRKSSTVGIFGLKTSFNFLEANNTIAIGFAWWKILVQYLMIRIRRYWWMKIQKPGLIFIK